MTPGGSEPTEVTRTIRERVIALAQRRGGRAHLEERRRDSGKRRSIRRAPELIIWIEMTFDLTIAQSELTVDNFGTIDAVSDYLATGIQSVPEGGRLSVLDTTRSPDFFPSSALSREFADAFLPHFVHICDLIWSTNAAAPFIDTRC
jgi:hypothetical protein